MLRIVRLTALTQHSSKGHIYQLYECTWPISDLSFKVPELPLFHRKLQPKNRKTQPVKSSPIKGDLTFETNIHHTICISPGSVHIEAITSDHIFAKKHIVPQCYQPQSEPVVLVVQCYVSPSGHYYSVLFSLKVLKGK